MHLKRNMLCSTAVFATFVASTIISNNEASAFSHHTFSNKINSRDVIRTFKSRNCSILHSLSHKFSEDEDNFNDTADINRRSALLSASKSAASLLALCNVMSTYPLIGNADEGMSSTMQKTPISASWKSVDGLNSLEENKKIVSFDPSAYKAMMDDASRTPLFEKAIKERLNDPKEAPDGPSSQIVLDMGTGPYALFALMAAKAGAGKVYAVEANKEAAKLARLIIKKYGYEDVITVLEGFSSEITLPNNEKADLVIAEIVGSVASEEGAYATILDAHKRLVKEPNKSSSWIPNRIQTYAAPASYTLHTLFQPPAFDWSKLNGEPVRFNCRDEGLQLLSSPALLEDMSFSDIEKYKLSATDVNFIIDGKRIQANTQKFNNEFRINGIKNIEADELSQKAGSTFTGVALWPRLVLDTDGKIEVNSRSYPSGGHQKSHWQTVLPIMNDNPVVIKGGDKVQVNFDSNLGGGNLLIPPSYKLSGYIISS